MQCFHTNKLDDGGSDLKHSLVAPVIGQYIFRIW